MSDKEHLSEVDVMDLPSIQLSLRDVPVPGPDRQNQARQQQYKLDRDMEDTVKKLIAHLKENVK